MAQLVKNLPVTRERWVRSLVWEDPPEKGKASHSSILAWRIPSPQGCKELGTTEQLSLTTHGENWILFKSARVLIRTKRDLETLKKVCSFLSSRSYFHVKECKLERVTVV